MYIQIVGARTYVANTSEKYCENYNARHSLSVSSVDGTSKKRPTNGHLSIADGMGRFKRASQKEE